MASEPVPWVLAEKTLDFSQWLRAPVFEPLKDSPRGALPHA